jgi:hypothetical protein
MDHGLRGWFHGCNGSFCPRSVCTSKLPYQKAQKSMAANFDKSQTARLKLQFSHVDFMVSAVVEFGQITRYFNPR